MEHEVGGLCVVVPPGGEVIVALGWPAVRLDLDTPNLQAIMGENKVKAIFIFFNVVSYALWISFCIEIFKINVITLVI